MILAGGSEEGVFGDEVLISGGGDGTIKIWALAADKGGAISELKTLESGDEAVLTLTIDDTLLYSGRAGGDINVWDLETCQLVRRIESHVVDVLTLCVGHGSVFSGSANGAVKVRGTCFPHLIRTADRSSNSVLAMSACMNGELMIDSFSRPRLPSTEVNGSTSQVATMIA